ncbi:MAG: hypothetical protein HY736_00865 [Verrucomicrobia bacterium]|nr:hypothetical protein [Verrucomicrobiota bacterium]
MPDQPPVTTDAFDRLNREAVAATLLPRDREPVLNMVDFLRKDLQAMRDFPVGESEPATIYDPAAER